MKPKVKRIRKPIPFGVGRSGKVIGRQLSRKEIRNIYEFEKPVVEGKVVYVFPDGRVMSTKSLFVYKPNDCGESG